MFNLSLGIEVNVDQVYRVETIFQYSMQICKIKAQCESIFGGKSIEYSIHIDGSGMDHIY